MDVCHKDYITAFTRVHITLYYIGGYIEIRPDISFAYIELEGRKWNSKHFLENHIRDYIFL